MILLSHGQRVAPVNETLNPAGIEPVCMSDDEEEETPTVTLGERTPVTGAPLARISSRLTWPIEASEIQRLEGESEIRTPDGPRTIADVMSEVNETYFERRQEFERHVRDVIGRDPVRSDSA